MVERIAAGLPGGPDQPRGDRLVGGLAQLRLRDVADPGDQLAVELAADRRGDGQRAVGRLREPVEAAADHLADALRDVELPRAGGGGRVLGQPPLAGEQADDLAEEERVALGLGVDRLGEAGRRLDPGRHLYVAGDDVGVEAAQRDPPRPLGGGELAEHPGERVMAAELDVAVGADDRAGSSRRARGPRTRAAAARAHPPSAGRRARSPSGGRVRPRSGTWSPNRRAGTAPHRPRARARRQLAEPLGDLGDELGDVGARRCPSATPSATGSASRT